jgi:hypothetical protein
MSECSQRTQHPYKEVFASGIPFASFWVLVGWLDLQHINLLIAVYAVLNSVYEIVRFIEWKRQRHLSADNEYLRMRMMFASIPLLFLILRWSLPDSWLSISFYVAVFLIWPIGLVMQGLKHIANRSNKQADT